MLFYDIEVFPHYWCVVVVDDENETRHVFEDVPNLRDFYKENRKMTWVGYNSRQYDAPMLRFIMLGLNPYKCSHDLIVLNKKWFEFGFNITEMYKRIPLRNFDCALLNKSLKKLEAFRGSSIKECSIPWDLDRPLTRHEKDEVIQYCTHDVLETRKVFYDTKVEYDAHESLIAAFDLPDENFNKSKAQLAAIILGAVKTPRFDEWDFEIADTLQLSKYKFVEDWYRDPANHSYDSKLCVDIAGVPHTFAWGGIHGAIPSYHGEGFYVNMDVASYYPAMMIEYGFLSRNVPDPTIFRRIRDDRMVFKKAKDPRQQPYKIVINGTFGAQKDKFNNLYDPRQANSICVSGQLLLLDLIEKLEPYCQIIQSNTDGVLVKLHNGTEDEYNQVLSIGQEWSARTRMDLEYETVRRVFQKDVNNYLTVDENKKWKSKGAYAKTWLREDKDAEGNKIMVDDYTDFDLPIIREAIMEKMVNDIPLDVTIYNCMELQRFQKIVMVSRKYDCGLHGKVSVTKGATMEHFTGEELPERILRVFASIDTNDGGIFKRHAVTKKLNKVGDTPTNAFIINDNLEGVTREGYPLDLDYYVKLAEKRIKNFYSKPTISI